MAIRSIEDIFTLSQKQETSYLGQLLDKSRKVSQIEEMIKNNLPLEFRNQFQVINVEENLLIIQIDNSSIGFKMRFHEQELLKVLNVQKEFSGLTKIQWKTKIP